MSDMRKTIIAVIIVAALTARVTALAQTHFLQNMPWEQVKEQGRAVGKLVFVDCYTSWCGPCKLLARNVFPQKNVGDYLNATFVCAQYDMEKGEGVGLYKKWKHEVNGFPTMLVIDPKTDEVMFRIVGYKEPDELLTYLKDGLRGKTVESYRRRYAAGERSIDFIEEFVRQLDIEYDTKTMKQVVSDYVESKPLDSLMNPRLLSLYLPYLRQPYTSQFAYVVTHFDSCTSASEDLKQKTGNRIRSVMESGLSRLWQKALSSNETDRFNLQSRVDSMDVLLQQNVPGFEPLRARLRITKTLLSNDMEALGRAADIEAQANATGRQAQLVPEVYHYVLMNTTTKGHKALISNCVKHLLTIQQEADRRQQRDSLDYFSMNYYDAIAVGYHRLKRQADSQKYAQKFREMNETQLRNTLAGVADSSKKGFKQIFERRLSLMEAALSQ